MQSRIQGTFGAGAQAWVPKVPLFCKAHKLISFVSNLSKAGHLRRLILNQMLHSRGKTQRFREKNMQQLPKPRYAIITSFQT